MSSPRELSTLVATVASATSARTVTNASKFSASSANRFGTPDGRAVSRHPTEHRARLAVRPRPETAEILAVDAARLEVIPEEAAAIEDAVSDDPEALEAVRGVRGVQGFVEEQRQGTLERLARASVGVNIVPEEGDQITRRAIGRVNALQTHGVFDRLEEEVGDRVCRDNGHESLLSLPIL